MIVTRVTDTPLWVLPQPYAAKSLRLVLLPIPTCSLTSSIRSGCSFSWSYWLPALALNAKVHPFLMAPIVSFFLPFLFLQPSILLTEAGLAKKCTRLTLMLYPNKVKLVLRSDLTVPVTPREGTIPTNVADNDLAPLQSLIREVKGQALSKLSHESSYSPKRMTSLILFLYDPLL